MSSTGNLFPSVGENVDRAGLTAWTNPGNIVSDNATDATCNGTGSDYLVARSFNFAAIPTNAVIGGVTVRIEVSEHSTGTEVLTAQLQDATAALFGNSKTATVSGTAKAVYTYGSTTDVWGASITGNIAHDADFGVRFWFTTAHDVRADYVTMAVEYTVPAHGLATESDAALSIGATKRIAMGLSGSTESALALEIAGGQEVPVGTATETNAALSLTKSKLLSPGVSAESGLALALTAVKLRIIGLSSEMDEAISPGQYTQIKVNKKCPPDCRMSRRYASRR